MVTCSIDSYSWDVYPLLRLMLAVNSQYLICSTRKKLFIIYFISYTQIPVELFLYLPRDILDITNKLHFKRTLKNTKLKCIVKPFMNYWMSTHLQYFYEWLCEVYSYYTYVPTYYFLFLIYCVILLYFYIVNNHLCLLFNSYKDSVFIE